MVSNQQVGMYPLGPLSQFPMPFLAVLQPPLSVQDHCMPMRGCSWPLMCEDARAREFFAVLPTPLLAALQPPLVVLAHDKKLRAILYSV
jgi:hypothetical protein